MQRRATAAAATAAVTLVAATLAAGTLSGCASGPADDAALEARRPQVEAILSEHATRYPDMRIQDLYKLLHQGAFGSEHAVPGYQQAMDWLASELVRLAAEGPGAADLPGPLVESLAPDGEVVRIHLRPYLKSGWDTGPLLEAFVRTAEEYPRSPDRLRSFADVAAGMARDGGLPFDPDSITAFFARLEADGFPAVHHSEAYETAYRPAYRVIARVFLPDSVRDWLSRAEPQPEGP